MSRRVMLVTDVYPPLIGGADRQNQLIAHDLVRRGYTVMVVTPWQVGWPAREDDQGASVVRIQGLAQRVPWFSVDQRRRHHPPFPDPAMVVALWRLIREFGPDIVLSYGWINYSLMIALLGTRIPLVVSMREYGHTCALRTMVRYDQQPCDGPGLTKCLGCASRYYGAPKGIVATLGVFGGKFLLRRRLDAVHSISTFVQELTWRDFFETPGGPPIRHARPLTHAIIPSFRESIQPSADDPRTRAQIALLPDAPFILFVGALRLVKGVRLLLNAYGKLQHAPRLVLIGPQAPDTPTTFPDGVIVLHDFTHAAVMEAWRRCVFGVAPSLWSEPFGNVIHEAMSHGKAMIGTRPGGHTDMIQHGETGLLVPIGDEAALRDAMQTLIDQPDYRERIGTNAQIQSNRYTSDVVVPQFMHLFERVINAQRPGAGRAERGL